MSAELAIQELRKDVRVLTDLVAAMADMIGPRVTRAQMLERLRVSSNTLTAGVSNGRYPKPANDGKWLLSEVIEWEKNHA